ncbi:hypothetical protein I3271_07035 [Photobacterium leiognathi]|uniref:hypothetical protein n=1 Tax=Photobacterium leiognathi TaxID=553611 RepID=UPI001EE0C103|nr:hypothetical protein [Photobacterium leiognathi]MCG3884440.1 hypothetical protein [Photobacterium leiognathi]
MNADKVSKYLLESNDEELKALGLKILNERELLIKSENECLNNPNDYWKRHKLVVGIDSDHDFMIKNNSEDSMSHDEWLEFTAYSRDEVLNEASKYLTDMRNYSFSGKFKDIFLKEYLNPALDHLINGNQNNWNSFMGNWDICFEYFEPETQEPLRTKIPQINLEIDAFTSSEAKRFRIMICD